MNIITNLVLKILEGDRKSVKDKYYYISNSIQLATYNVAIFYGEHLQNLAENKLRNYDWMQGHLSDFASLALINSVIMFNTKTKYYDPLILGAAMTVGGAIGEMANPDPFDWQDIACYAGGALLAWAVPHAKEIAKDTKEYFKSKFSRNRTIDVYVK